MLSCQCSRWLYTLVAKIFTLLLIESERPFGFMYSHTTFITLAWYWFHFIRLFICVYMYTLYNILFLKLCLQVLIIFECLFLFQNLNRNIGGNQNLIWQFYDLNKKVNIQNILLNFLWIFLRFILNSLWMRRWWTSIWRLLIWLVSTMVFGTKLVIGPESWPNHMQSPRKALSYQRKEG